MSKSRSIACCNTAHKHPKTSMAHINQPLRIATTHNIHPPCSRKKKESILSPDIATPHLCSIVAHCQDTRQHSAAPPSLLHPSSFQVYLIFFFLSKYLAIPKNHTDHSLMKPIFLIHHNTLCNEDQTLQKKRDLFQRGHDPTKEN
jgi:hypothetical protein